MRYLILAHPDDETAIRVFLSIRARYGPDNVHMVTAEDLEMALGWTHRLEGEYITSDIRLADGAIISSRNIGVVLNRLYAPSMRRFRSASKEDREYAIMEMYALWMSWLYSLPCPVINRASHRGISAQERSLAEWLFLAGRAGLPVRKFCLTSNPRWKRMGQATSYDPVQYHGFFDPFLEEPSLSPEGTRPLLFMENMERDVHRVLCIGDIILGCMDENLLEGVRRLQGLAGCDLMEAFFRRSVKDGKKEWKLCGVSTHPIIKDRQGIEAVVDLMETAVVGCTIEHQRGEAL